MANEEDIQRLAYSIWEQEGRPDGRDVDHYLLAKHMLEEREATPARPIVHAETAHNGLGAPTPIAPSTPQEGNAPRRYGRRRKAQ